MAEDRLMVSVSGVFAATSGCAANIPPADPSEARDEQAAGTLVEEIRKIADSVIG